MAVGESWVIVTLLGLISVCAVAVTVAMVMTAGEVRRTLSQLRHVLPRCEETMREAHRTLAQSRQLLISASHSMRVVEALTDKAYEAALEAMRGFARLKKRTRGFLAHRFGLSNGARPGPRRRAQG